MRSYTAHLKPGKQPVLLREGWSWGAFLFGPLWLLAHRAWLPALALAVLLGLTPLLRGNPAPVIAITLLVLAGLFGRDLLRWSLARRGYVMQHVLAARDEDAALGRLLTFRPDLAAGLAALLR